MDLRQLAALVAVAEAGSFSAAARVLHTVQSNVSTHVAHLERELGATLIDRTTMTLTEAGDAVVARARRVRRELEFLEADVAALHDEVRGTVRLGCIGTVGRWLVPRLIVLLAERHTLLKLVVVDASTTSLLPQLLTDRLDLAVLNMPVQGSDITTEKLFDENRVLLAPTHHPLARETSVTLAQVAEYPMLLEPTGTGFRDELDTAAVAASVELIPLAEVDGLRLVTSLAIDGFGPAIVPSTAAPAWLRGNFRTIPIVDLLPRSVGLTRRRHGRLSAPARAVRVGIMELVDVADHPGLHPDVRPLEPRPSGRRAASPPASGPPATP